MPNTKITDLPALTAASGDEIPVNRAGADGKITVGGIVNLSQTPWLSNIDANGFNLLVDNDTGIKSTGVGNGPLLLFTGVASAINCITITNGVAGDYPVISPTGDTATIKLQSLAPLTDSGLAIWAPDSGARGTFNASDGNILEFIGSGANFRIITETLHDLRFGTDTDGAGGTRWVIQGTDGHFRPFLDDTFDIGTDTRGIRNIVKQTGYHEFIEMTAPVAGAANTVRAFSQDNGAGKTQWCLQFPTGSPVVVATEA